MGLWLGFQSTLSLLLIFKILDKLMHTCEQEPPVVMCYLPSYLFLCPQSVLSIAGTYSKKDVSHCWVSSSA